MDIRLRQEEWESEYLSAFAAHSVASKGRDIYEPMCDIRTVYQRDRDRILHCKSFRRLKDKTQVFLAPKGDHYRTRMMHTLEVSQTARTVARALKLNEDLTEAIALGHDLGHTPFGHTGEAALNSITKKGFKHNKQSVRVVECLEKYGKGLNLTWEVRDGIFNHKTVGKPATLEGKIVRLADKIAYINSDIDDSIRADILREKDIPIEFRESLGSSSRERLNNLILDVIENSYGQNDISMSESISESMKGLREFMFKRVYINSLAKQEEGKAKALVKSLYEYYYNNIEKLPEHYIIHNDTECCREVVVCDYISGMTDGYAIEQFKELFVPSGWEKR